MGLDVYLHTAAQAAQNAAYDKACEEWWAEGADGESPRDRATEDERKAWSASYSYTSYDDVPSEEFPDHLFNRRYLRSSYNGGGFNHAVPDLLGTSADEYPNAKGSLYWIFEPMGREWDGDEGALTDADLPKMGACQDRALEIHAALAASDRLRVTTVSPNMFGVPSRRTDHQALAMYRTHVAERGREIEAGDWYSTAGGDLNVYGGGLSILAAIPGMDTFTPGVHLIYRMEGDAFDSYVQSAKITAEFCAEAIMLIKRDGSCKMSWSG